MPAVAPIYMSVNDFTLRTLIPSGQVAVLINNRTGLLEKLIDQWSRYIDARLRKRYVTPFLPSATGPAPAIVLMWLTFLVQRDALTALGTNVLNDGDRALIDTGAERALTELAEAANEENGLFDLPLRDDMDPSAVVEEAPLMSTDTSPYSWIDREGPDGRRP